MTRLERDELLPHLRSNDGIRTRLQHLRLLRYLIRKNQAHAGASVEAHQLRTVSASGTHHERNAVARIELATKSTSAEGANKRGVVAHLCVGVHCRRVRVVHHH